MKVMVETSAHHVHVSEADLEALFGKGAALTNKKDLSQPGQFACEEKVEVVGPKGTMKMSILGPTRPETQVEISLDRCPQAGRHRPHPGVRRPGGHPRLRAPRPRWGSHHGEGRHRGQAPHPLQPRRGQRGRRGGQAGGLREGGLQRPRPDLSATWCAASAPSTPWPCTWTPTKSNAAGLPGTVDGEIIL